MNGSEEQRMELMSDKFKVILMQEKIKDLIFIMGKYSDESESWRDAMVDIAIRLNNLAGHLENVEKKW